MTVSRIDFLMESSGEWELGRETVTVGVVGVGVATAAVPAMRRGRDIVAFAGELGEVSVRDERGRRDRRVAIMNTLGRKAGP